MTAQWMSIHPKNPQARSLAQAVARLRAGAVIAYPTDSCYAFGCQLDDREAADRLRHTRQFDRHHHFTLMCRDLSQIATYARVDNTQFRLLKRLTPGPYTFVLEATKELPRRVAHEKRRTIGIRIPDHPVTQALLESLGEPLISCTLQLPEHDEPISDPNDIRDTLSRAVDIVLDAGPCGLQPTTVLDLETDPPRLLRQGRGDVSDLVLQD